jgi:hypothetical protein
MNDSDWIKLSEFFNFETSTTEFNYPIRIIPGNYKFRRNYVNFKIVSGTKPWEPVGQTMYFTVY